MIQKIHYLQLTKEDHHILHHYTGLFSKLFIDGIFANLFDTRTRTLTVENFRNNIYVSIDIILELEGTTWESYYPSMAKEAFIDINRDIFPSEYVDTILVEHNKDYTTLLSSLNVMF